MKCISCEIEINPQWKHAIDINVCPFCGKHIMEEKLKNLFSSLSDTMDNLLEYPDQLNDWMLSNHNYIKTDSPQIVAYMPQDMLKELRQSEKDKNFEERKDRKFTVKVQTESGEQEIEAEKIQSEEATSDFFKRAEAVKPKIDGFNSTAEKTKHLKNLAQQIKKAGSPIMNESGAGGMISPEMMENADPEAVAEFQSLISGGEVASSIPEAGGDDEIPSVVLAMANKSKGSSYNNSADLLKLQKMQERNQQSRRDFESGANRGSKGGGFSRS